MQTSSSGQVGVLGQAGATYTSITLQPSAKLDDTYFALTRYVQGSAVLYKLPYGVGIEQQLYEASGFGSSCPSISAYGTIAFFSGSGLGTVRADGTGFKGLSFTGAINSTIGAYAVDGTNRIAFQGSLAPGTLFVGPGTGGAATAIQTNVGGGGNVAWNPSGTQIAYPVSVGSAGNTDIFSTPSTGGMATDITPAVLRNTGAFLNPTWNPDGTSIAVTYLAPGSTNYETVKFSAANPYLSTTIPTPAGDEDQYPVFSPDGTKLAFYRDSENGATPGIYVADSVGVDQSLFLSDPSGYACNGLAWSPFLPKETVVAASGSTFYHASASGFLLSQVHDQFGSFVAFTATTPSSATIQAPAATAGTQPLLFTITADAITQFGYINNYFATGVTETLASTPTVVVSIDAGTGQVDLVAPAATAKPALRTNADGTLTYLTSFKAIYDGTGRNLAPSGASALTVNPKTGKLVAFT